MLKYIQQIDIDINLIEIQIAQLVKAKLFLCGSKEERRKEKIRQAALLRHKKDRDEKIAKINELLKQKEVMTTKEISDAIKMGHASTLRILKTGGFKYIAMGKWTLSETQTNVLGL